MNLPLSSDPLPSPDDQLTPNEAARLTRASLRSVYRWVQRGNVRAWRVGPRLRLSREDVLALCCQVERGQVLPPPLSARRRREQEAALEECRRRGLC